MLITRRFEFDAGHRIPDHQGPCRNLHGHRYALEVTLSGEIVRKEGQAGNGMVVDFSEIKALVHSHLIAHWDHAFLAYSEDRALVDFLHSIPDHKTVVLDRIPTAENLADAAFEILDRVFSDAFGKRLRVERVRLYETPNCWADALRK
ncbi:MAG: 6-carboxytetrahydropterin synthase QueD [Candidatus Accumulibacter sp.]|jgi:6-pyruvoyltetrahydropterin/6-carboxytetrahydropterin synthase|nr:6-carboxytetrahydropterin synthase QueD [Accumulibacter sp.]